MQTYNYTPVVNVTVHRRILLCCPVTLSAYLARSPEAYFVFPQEYIAHHLLVTYLFYSWTSSMGCTKVLYVRYYVSVLHFFDPWPKKYSWNFFKNYSASTVLRKNIHILVGMFRAVRWLFDHINKRNLLFLEWSVLLFSTIINIQHDKYFFSKSP